MSLSGAFLKSTIVDGYGGLAARKQWRAKHGIRMAAQDSIMWNPGYCQSRGWTGPAETFLTEWTPAHRGDSDALAGFTRPDFHRRFPSPSIGLNNACPGQGRAPRCLESLEYTKSVRLLFGCHRCRKGAMAHLCIEGVSS